MNELKGWCAVGGVASYIILGVLGRRKEQVAISLSLSLLPWPTAGTVAQDGGVTRSCSYFTIIVLYAVYLYKKRKRSTTPSVGYEVGFLV